MTARKVQDRKASRCRWIVIRCWLIFLECACTSIWNEVGVAAGSSYTGMTQKRIIVLIAHRTSHKVSVLLLLLYGKTNASRDEKMMRRTPVVTYVFTYRTIE